MALKINDNGKDRNMTPTEEAAHLAWAVIAQAEAEAREQDDTAKIAARENAIAKLTALGLTADEAAALFG